MPPPLTARSPRSAPAARGRGRGRGDGVLLLELAEQLARELELRGDDLLCRRQQLEDARVAHAVQDARADLAALVPALTAHRRQVLRRAAGVEPERGLQITDAALVLLAQELEDPNARGMAEEAEELGLEAVHRSVLVRLASHAVHL